MVIKENKDGIPSLFFHEKHDIFGKERLPKEGNHFIAKVVNSNYFRYASSEQYKYEHLFADNTLLYVYPQGDEIKSGFVDCALTPAAYDKLDEFINEAKERGFTGQEHWLLLPFGLLHPKAL
ncbi:MAG: hypothetical protein PWQ43_541 [Rikenellaceae bacterium]|nr:hypothetical protein [Rikenellaceae bacterium]